MKIAVITDDGQTISAHFGRARHFLVYTVEGNTILTRELRDKAGHDDFETEQHHHDDHLPGEGAEHDDHSDHHSHHGRHDSRGHGFGRGAGRRHARMLSAIQGCDALLARGMGQGAYLALQKANIVPITTELKLAEEAVRSYLAGEIVDRPERRH
jgi:predicted Fe-Mo cluster-binding NifX family protein